MIQTVVRSLTNDALAVLDMGILFLLLVWANRRIRHPEWYSRSDTQTFAALLTYFSGITVVRTWTAILLWSYEHGVNATAVENQYPLALAGTMVCAVGALFFIRIASPIRWGHWPWMITGAAALGVAVGLRFI